jgi:hypothetical protein
MPIYAAYICVVMVEEAGYFSGTRLRTWTGSEDLRGVLAPCWTASKKTFSRGSQAAVVCRPEFEVELNLCVRR